MFKLFQLSFEIPKVLCVQGDFSLKLDQESTRHLL